MFHQLETLRLYGSVLRIPKRTSSIPQSLQVDGQDMIVPPHTDIYCNSIALHTHPDYWGLDSLSWLPSRWIGPTDTAESVSADVSATQLFPREELYKPIQGSYIPWADGARNCPGKAFAQVEFVAVMITLLSKYRIQVLPEAGETSEQARKRVYETVEDSRLKLTLQMRNPGSVCLRLVRR
jgi:cytochrome P450